MRALPFQVIPRELAFFDLLEQAAANCAEAARELRAMVDELGEATDRSGRIRELEHKGDELTHQIARLLNATFVTPVDRQDIHHLASHLDDVVDSMTAVSELLILLRIAEPLTQFRQQADVLVLATEAVTRAMRDLRALAPPRRVSIEILRLERDGDHIHRSGIAALFAGSYAAMDVLKWKDILDEMERAVDRCEDVANDVDAIAVKFS